MVCQMPTLSLTSHPSGALPQHLATSEGASARGSKSSKSRRRTMKRRASREQENGLDSYSKFADTAAVSSVKRKSGCDEIGLPPCSPAAQRECSNEQGIGF